MNFSDAELEGYVDEALPAERMTAIEEAGARIADCSAGSRR